MTWNMLVLAFLIRSFKKGWQLYFYLQTSTLGLQRRELKYSKGTWSK